MEEVSHKLKNLVQSFFPKRIPTLQRVRQWVPRNFRVDVAVRRDELKKEDLLAKIWNQFSRLIEGLEEAFEE